MMGCYHELTLGSSNVHGHLIIKHTHPCCDTLIAFMTICPTTSDGTLCTTGILLCLNHQIPPQIIYIFYLPAPNMASLLLLSFSSLPCCSWHLGQTTQVQKNNYTINLPSNCYRYELQVRGRIGDRCEKSDFWSDWSPPVFWGSMTELCGTGKKTSCPQPNNW